MRAWRQLAALLGRLVGLRTHESEVTLTVEGKWKGWFDPVRLGLTALVVALALLLGICAACSNLVDLGDTDPVTQGPYHIPTPAGATLAPRRR